MSLTPAGLFFLVRLLQKERTFGDGGRKRKRKERKMEKEEEEERSFRGRGRRSPDRGFAY